MIIMVDLIDKQGRSWQITIGSDEATCDGEIVTNDCSFEIDARPNRIWVNGKLAHAVKVGDDWWIHLDGSVNIISVDEQGAGNSSDDSGMTAPMPGKVLEILCSIGEQVEVGQTLIVMEAMKMEHRIAANISGEIVAIHHQAGEQVDAGATLIDIEDNE